MERFKKKALFNKHFIVSLMFFLGVLLITTTFIEFLKDTKKHDINLVAKENDKLDNRN